MEIFGIPLQAFMGQLLIGLINGSFYALLSLGLAVIFGLLNIINFTHGAQYMLGAFVAYLSLTHLGVNYWAALVLCPLVVGATGVLIERLMLKHLYKLDHLYGLLLTFGLALIIQGLFRNEFGSSGMPYPVPEVFQGVFNTGFMFLPKYRAWVIVASLVVCLATWYVIERTKLGAYLRAATENPSLVQAFGHRVLSVAGDRMAMKVTTADDLILASHLVGGEQRTGIGTDTHRFSEEADKPLYLGTILWDGERGLDGHSDGDALSHAIVDALLSAAGLGDIGSNFGVDRPEFTGANGKVFLEETLVKLHSHGFSVINVSAQIIGNRPKVAPMRVLVEQALTAIIHAPVTISATTTDGLGFLGNTEGVAVVASALIQQAKK